MCDPLAHFHGLGLCTEGQEVTLHDVLCVIGVEPERLYSRKMVRGKDLLGGGRRAP